MIRKTVAAMAATLSVLVLFGSVQGATPVAEQIRTEATRPDTSEVRPLPLASHWTAGDHKLSEDWGLHTQLKLIDEGHYLLPWLSHPRKERPELQPRIEKLAELKLPFVLLATQWESLLTNDPGYMGLPAEKNPNVVELDGKIKKAVSPFGPIEPWREVGRTWTDNAGMKQLQQLYPDPPLVIFLSNNEHGKLRWTQVETSKRYVNKYGKGKEDHFKRRVVADGWIERYRALQEGMREGLANETWKKNAIFVGYGAFGLEHFGRWGGWRNYSLCSPGRLDPNPLMWDGGSPSYYTHNWNPSTDFKTWSPQVEFQNDVFQQRLARQMNPNFWIELSIWDGYTGGTHIPAKPNDKRKYYESLGQTFTPERYRGFVQFGLWLMRPRAVREFRGWIHPWQDGKPYFMAIIAAVDLVHENPVLCEWWRKGELVPNRAHEHPYQVDIPEEYQDENRWFLLDANVNSREYPWEMFWEVRVFAIALVRGQAPKRQWLVYAHSPLADRKNVELMIPVYGEITVDVSIGGSFYEVYETEKSVRAVAR